MPVLPSQMKVPMRMLRMIGQMRVWMAVHVQSACQSHPHGQCPQRNETEAAQHLASALDNQGNVPAEHEHDCCADGEQQCVAERKPYRDSHGPSVSRLLPRRTGG